MRIYIKRMRPGEMDGVSLAFFQVGLTYDVSTSLATYLIAMDCADPVIDDSPALVTKLDTLHEIAFAVNQTSERAVAAEHELPNDFRLQVPLPPSDPPRSN